MKKSFLTIALALSFAGSSVANELTSCGYQDSKGYTLTPVFRTNGS